MKRTIQEKSAVYVQVLSPILDAEIHDAPIDDAQPTAYLSNTK